MYLTGSIPRVLNISHVWHRWASTCGYGSHHTVSHDHPCHENEEARVPERIFKSPLLLQKELFTSQKACWRDTFSQPPPFCASEVCFPQRTGEAEGEECPRAVARTRPPPRSTGRLALGTFRLMGWGKLLPWNTDNSYSHPPSLLESRSWDWLRWRLQLWELACSIPMVLSTHHVALEPRVWVSSLEEKWMCAQNWSSGASVCISDLFILQMLY